MSHTKRGLPPNHPLGGVGHLGVVTKGGGKKGESRGKRKLGVDGEERKPRARPEKSDLEKKGRKQRERREKKDG